MQRRFASRCCADGQALHEQVQAMGQCVQGQPAEADHEFRPDLPQQTNLHRKPGYLWRVLNEELPASDEL
jgi:hypothetical protein